MGPHGPPGAPLGLWAPGKIPRCPTLSTALPLIMTLTKRNGDLEGCNAIRHVMSNHVIQRHPSRPFKSNESSLR